MTGSDPVNISALGTLPKLAISREDGNSTVLLYGWPYFNNSRITSLAPAAEILNDPALFAKSLDGEFCLVIESPDQFVIVSDRFVSHPLFYALIGDELIYSFSYSKIWEHLSSSGQLHPDKYAIYEFLKFQRLFGNKTLDRSSKMLRPATVLNLDKHTLKFSTTKYWSPNFSKRHDSTASIASDLASVVQQSIRRKTDGIENIGLLLSGGMDSRVVLGGFDRSNPPSTFTVGSFENNEYDVAKELAGKTGSPHYFVKRGPTHYADILPSAVSAGGGMYSYQHGHFFGLNLPAKTDLLLHGHGFDYMFQGMYLPARRRTFLGKTTHSYELTQPNSIVDAYVDSAKYKLKGIDPSGLLQTNEISYAEESVRSSIQSIVDEVKDSAEESFDVWDYLTLGAPGRHYTYLNLLSAGSLAPQQTVAWDNSIFNLFFTVPAHVRFGTKLLAETIKILQPELLDVRNANTNLSPKLSGASLTMAAWRRGISRRVGMSQISDPSQEERSWPTGTKILNDSDSLSKRANDLFTSDALLQLDLFAPDLLQKTIEGFKAGQHQLGSAILTLITLDEFLSKPAYGQNNLLNKLGEIRS